MGFLTDLELMTTSHEREVLSHSGLKEGDLEKMQQMGNLLRLKKAAQTACDNEISLFPFHIVIYEPHFFSIDEQFKYSTWCLYNHIQNKTYLFLVECLDDIYAPGNDYHIFQLQYTSSTSSPLEMTCDEENENFV